MQEMVGYLIKYPNVLREVMEGMLVYWVLIKINLNVS